MVYVDIPTPECVGDENAGWMNVATLETKAEAVEFIRQHFGPCDGDGNVCLISG